jgi:hypothetical protein
LKIFTTPSRKRDAPEPSNIIDPKECIKRPRLSRRQKKRMRTIPEPEEPTVYKKKSIEVNIDRSICYASFSHQRSIEPPPMLLPKNRKELILARILFAYYEYLDILHESRMKRKNYIKQCLVKMFPKEFTTQKRKKKFLKRCLPISNIIETIYKRHNRSRIIYTFNAICPERVRDIFTIALSAL